MQVSKNFDLREFIDPITWQERGDKSMNLIDPRLVKIAQWIRDSTNLPVVINNWHTNGPGHVYWESGLRSKNSKTGAPRSAHKEGKAIDVKIQGMNGAEMNEWASAHRKELYAMGVRQIEDHKITTTWLHLGLRGESKGIQIIDLNSVIETWEV